MMRKTWRVENGIVKDSDGGSWFGLMEKDDLIIRHGTWFVAIATSYGGAKRDGPRLLVLHRIVPGGTTYALDETATEVDVVDERIIVTSPHRRIVLEAKEYTLEEVARHPFESIMLTEIEHEQI